MKGNKQTDILRKSLKLNNNEQKLHFFPNYKLNVNLEKITLRK